jgi:CspA family cold shock protein
LKRFAFIASDRGGKDIFVHASALDRAWIAGLTEGQRVAVEALINNGGGAAPALTGQSTKK